MTDVAMSGIFFRKVCLNVCKYLSIKVNLIDLNETHKHLFHIKILKLKI